MDSISESKIQEAIDPIIHSRTSILIAHRLSTILAADEILVIKDGVIAERGVHKDLVKQDGVYAELYKTQFSRAWENESGSEAAEQDDDAVCACGVDMEETLRRVRYMERLLDEVLAAQKDTERTWPWYRMRQLKVLEDYYENGLWKLDYESDEKGLLPKSMKRGVLAQDTLYNLFDEVWQLRKENPCKGKM